MSKVKVFQPKVIYIIKFKKADSCQSKLSLNVKLWQTLRTCLFTKYNN